MNLQSKRDERAHRVEALQAGEGELGWEAYLVLKECGVWEIRGEKNRDMWSIVWVYALVNFASVYLGCDTTQG